MIRATSKIIGWLALVFLAIVLFAGFAAPVAVIYLALVAIATPIILVTLPWAKQAVWQLAGEYLLRRRLAWVSLIAVTLCVAMVLVVLSVMGGWLTQFRSQFKVLSGDLVISKNSANTFAHYEEMIGEIKQRPDVAGAIPIIRSVGLLSIPTYRWNDMVAVVGLPPVDEVEKVMSFKESLWLQHQIGDYDEKPLRDDASFKLYDDLPYGDMAPRDKSATRNPGMIVGAGAIAVRMDRLTKRPTWPEYLREINTSLTVVPMNEELGAAPSQIDAKTTHYWIVDGSRTQAPQHDNNIYVPFDQLQQDLKLTSYTYRDAVTKEQFTEPAKTSEIQIKLKPGTDVQAAKRSIQAIVDRILRAHDPNATTNPADDINIHLGALRVLTWDEQPKTAQFLNAVENEITIMMTLFGFISLVAVFMVFCIFYTIVGEKTRDIGILKSVGGSAWTVAQIFLTYGAAIGLVGGGLGVAIGWAFVHWINEIQDLITRISGREIYSSDVYAIDRLPTHVDPKSAAIIMLIGVVAAIGGALVPAVLAARKKPVDALRFE